MKKVFTIVLVLFIFAGVVIGVLTLTVKLYLTDERVRSYLVAASESFLGRRVALGAIQVSLFKGITLKDLHIKEKDSDESFMKVQDFVLKYRLVPLLSKSLVIDEIKLAGTVLRVRRKADGRFNFSDITGTAGAGETRKPAPAASGLPFSLQVRSIILRDIVVDFAEPDGTLLEGRIKIDAELGLSSRSAGVISSKGSFRISVVEAFLKGHPRPLKDVASQGTYKTNFDLVAKKADNLEVSAKIAGSPFTAKGYVSYGDPFFFSLDLGLPEIRLATAQQAFAPLLPEGMGFDGVASLAVSAQKLSLPGSPLTFRGQLAMNGVAVAVKDYRPVINGTIGFTPLLITLDDIRLVMGENLAEVSGKIKDYSREPDIQVSVKAKSLNLDTIFPRQSPGAEKAEAPSPAAQEKEFEPMTKMKLRAAGSVAIDKLLVNDDVEVQNLATAFEFRDNILRIQSMTGNTLNGSFGFRSAIDLSRQGTAYTLRADINGVELEDITKAFAPKARDTLYGSLYGKMNLSGAGTLKENIKSNLKGKGSFTVKNGKIKNARISGGLLGFLGLQDLREIPLDKADGTFALAHRVVDLTTLVTSKDLKITEKGTIGMDERLDLHIMVKASKKLAPKMLGQSSISRFLSAERGWTGIPLRVRGTIEQPSYSVDMEYISRTATKKLREKAAEELFKALSGDKEKQSETQPEEQKKDTGPEDLLKGIFGK